MATADKELANVLLGMDLGLYRMKHERKVMQLANTVSVWDAMMQAGWHEHTNDWDWECCIYMKDGTRYFNINVIWEMPFAKDEYPVSKEEEAKNIIFYDMGYDEEGMARVDGDDEIKVTIPIDDIHHIEFDW